MIIFTANEGNMSASNMAPVDNVLQDLIPVWFVVVIVPFVGCIPGSVVPNLLSRISCAALSITTYP